MRFLLLLALAACPGKPVDHPKTIDDTAVRVQIAQLEAARGDGLEELDKLATSGDQHTRVLAVRGLGRVGGAKALATLTAALGDPDIEISDTAATAIGIATSLDEDDAGKPEITAALLALQAKRPDDPAIVEAIGRAADGAAQQQLAASLHSNSPVIAAEAAIALGRFGRRKIELSATSRSALIEACKRTDERVRLAAAYALAREHLVKPEESTPEKSTYLADSGKSLAALLADKSPAIRAQAAQALARRKTVIGFKDGLMRATDDTDWRVAVEAVRALGGDASNDELRVFTATSAFRWMQRAGGAHVVTEALRTLAPHSKLDAVRAVIGQIQRSSESKTSLGDSWITCLAVVANLRGTSATLEAGACKLPDHLKFPLVGELIAAKVGTVETRRAALQPMLAHNDPRVRVAGMTALASMWSDGGPPDHEATVATVIAAMSSKDGLVAGTAIETAETIYTEVDKSNETALRERLDTALLARAQTEQDPELATALFGTISKRKLAAGVTACRAGVKGNPVLAKAAVECLKALGEVVELPPIAGAKAPPVDVTAVIGKRVIWKLATTRGPIEIELRPDVAPWAVATIVALTRKQYYDGLELHRVVPNFVAQGGDPTQSGWGGPGFAIPAEPSTGMGYVEGGVGMADAGRDSAGSQWFIMHGAAPHLDGRYTWVGKVISGQTAANSLLIGDRVETATVDVKDRP